MKIVIAVISLILSSGAWSNDLMVDGYWQLRDLSCTFGEATDSVFQRDTDVFKMDFIGGRMFRVTYSQQDCYANLTGSYYQSRENLSLALIKTHGSCVEHLAWLTGPLVVQERSEQTLVLVQKNFESNQTLCTQGGDLILELSKF